MKRASRAILLAVVALLITHAPITHAESPEMPHQDSSYARTEIGYYATQYGVSSALLDSVMECESHGRQSTVSDFGRSIGIFQIQRPTWRRFTGEMHETLDINSSRDQSKVAAWAFAHGHAHEWTTAVAIQKGGRYTFWDRLAGREMTVKCSLASGTAV